MAGEWRRMYLADAVEIISGGTPKTTVPDYWGGDIPWLSVSDFNNGYRWVSTAEKYITKRGLSESATKLLNQGDIIISARGTVGALAQLAKPMAFNQSCYGLRGKKGIAETDFVYYVLRQSVSDMKQVAHGGVFDTITRDTFKIIECDLPPLPEQQAIACILGALDDKIELNRQMNRTLEEMARAIFKSWFVDFDPVRAKAAGQQPPGLKPEIAALFPDSFEDSELGEIPKGWSVESLDKTAHFLNGLALQKYPPTGEETLPVIKIAQLRSGNTTGADRCNIDLPVEYVVEDGDVLFSWSGSLECVLWSGGNGALNQHLFKVTSAQYPKWFYYLWINHHLPQFRHIAAGKATTMGHIQRHHLSDAKVIVPGQPLVSLTSDLLGSIIERVVHNNIQSRTLAALRDTLLPKLISGELRVPDAERIAGRCV